MGYNSTFTLEITEPKYPTISEIIAELRAANADAKAAIDKNGDPLEAVKWYGSHDDMKGISQRYPDHVFMLRWIGEDGEQAVHYFQNGKVQDAEVVISFAPFDPAKLK